MKDSDPVSFGLFRHGSAAWYERVLRLVNVAEGEDAPGRMVNLTHQATGLTIGGRHPER